MLMIGICEHYKQLHTVLCFRCRLQTITFVYRCHLVTTGIGIDTWYRHRSKQKVSVSEVSVNCGIGFTLDATSALGDFMMSASYHHAVA